MKIPLFNPIFNKEMKEAALAALENEFFVQGESVKKFEEAFAKYIGTKYAVSTSSGTNALFLSLAALEVKSQDRIITTPMSFIATSNAILHANGLPVFSDIEEASGNINANNIKITNEKGIIPVHLYGNPCDMDKILALKESNKDFFVVEDACQAHGASYKGKKAGSIGDVGCFSFYSTKNMTVGGDGGMVTTTNEELASKIKKLTNCGRISKYEHDIIGYTARLNTLNAAIGLVQLKYLDKWNEQRRAAAKIYKQNLPKEILLKEYGDPSYYTFTIKASTNEQREKIMQTLTTNEIESGIYFPIPIHLQPVYKNLFNYKEGSFPITENFTKHILSIPIFPGITNDQIKLICEKINEVLK